jgi:TatA/E family protein of Tat protein translocase
MPNIGAPELIIILVIALLILGPGKLPEVGASIGKSLREFRKASSDVQEATKLDVSVAPIPPVGADGAAPVAAATAATAATVAAADVAPAPAPDADAIAAAKATLAAADAAGVETTPTSTTSGSSAPAN